MWAEVELLIVKLVVHEETTGLYRVKNHVINACTVNGVKTPHVPYLYLRWPHSGLDYLSSSKRFSDTL